MHSPEEITGQGNNAAIMEVHMEQMLVHEMETGILQTSTGIECRGLAN